MNSAPKSTVRSAKRKASNVKKQIKKILTPTVKKDIFYYEQRQLIYLMLCYMAVAILVYAVSKYIVTEDYVCSWATVITCVLTMFLSLSALASIVFVIIYPQKLAVLSDKGIKIDHNPTLLWQDIATAEEKLSSALTRRPIICLHVKPERLKTYKLTFMQKLCKHNTFTPFSIPLYAMTPADREKIIKLIKSHVKKYKS